MEIKIIINSGPPPRAKRYRATPEEMERNRKEIAAQREIDERIQAEANQISNTDATQNSSTHQP